MNTRHLLDFLEQSADKFPDKVAFIDEKREITFAELEIESRRFGTFLSQKVQEKNQPIGVFTGRRIDSLVMMLAVLQSGNFYVPIDEKIPVERGILFTKSLRFLLCTEENQQQGEKLCDNILTFTTEQEENVAILKENREKTLDIDPAYMIFTSGSTGTPKGIVVSHGSVIDFTQWLTEFMNYDSQDVFGNQAPFFFDLSVKDVYQTLALGATCVIFPQKYFSFPKLLLEAMETHSVTAINWATSAFHLLSNSGVLEKMPPKSLKKITVGGEALQSRCVNIWKRAVPVQIANLYGPTEVTVDCTAFHLTEEFADNVQIPIGKACFNKEIILLSEELSPVTRGEVGEICVRGIGLAQGYYGDWEKTKAKFIQNPFCPHYPDLIYRTGDLAFENSDGNFVFVARNDSQIKHLGYRIELADIEQSMIAVEGVNSGICIFDGSKDLILAVYTGNVDEKVLEKSLREKLPKYMLPNRYYLLEEMPMTANQKIDRVYLKEKFVK